MTGLVNSTDPDSYDCSCGSRIRNCAFWMSVSAEMARRHFSFDPGQFDTRFVLGASPLAHRLLGGALGNTALEDARDFALRALPAQYQRLRYLIARNKALAASILAVSGKSVFLDASKSSDAIRHFSRERDIDFRIVHLVRDVRGFVCSRRKNKGETDLRRIASRWTRANSTIERQLLRVPSSRWIRVRYEDVCIDPPGTLNRFFEFCGLAPMGEAEMAIPRNHHIVGNRMRLGSIGTIQPDENWRTLLTADDQAQIAQIALKMHLRYGYKTMAKSDLISGVE